MTDQNVKRNAKQSIDAVKEHIANVDALNNNLKNSCDNILKICSMFKLTNDNEK